MILLKQIVLIMLIYSVERESRDIKPCLFNAYSFALTKMVQFYLWPFAKPQNDPKITDVLRTV